MISSNKVIDFLSTKVKNQILKAKVALGIAIPIQTEDRYILEKSIIPYFVAKSEIQKVLFVGCEWYTTHYNRYFANKEYWTIEITPEKRKYGSRKHHIIAPIQDLAEHCSENYFDLIIFNGVWGWGLNQKQDTEKSISDCYKCLRPNGILIFGWNDIPEAKPFSLEECQSFSKFQPYYFPPLSASHYPVLNAGVRHVFDFYIKATSEL